MPPSRAPIPQYAAEPPQEPLPYGRWAEALADHFAAAAGGELGRRSPGSRSAASAGAPTCPPPRPSDGGEAFGYVSYTRAHEGAQAPTSPRVADHTDATAAENPDWTLDLSDEEIGHWRGTQGRRGVVTLVWGVALVPNGVVATAELGPTHHGPVRARGGPLHARVTRRLHGRLRGGPPLRRGRSGAGPRVALRGGRIALSVLRSG